jgi:4-amino-4-deoxy-L-arabinose transferase-like glycosyltransferase
MKVFLGQLVSVPRPVWVIIATSFVIRLALAAWLPAGNDEAYYYAYALNPSLSYFDHPPVVALLAGFGPAITGIAGPFTIRLGAIVLFVATSLLFYRLARSFTDERGAFFALLALNCCPLTILGACAAVLPDASLAICWTGALLILRRILLTEESTPTDWTAAGVLSGLAMLSKYHGFLLPGLLGMYLLIYRRDLLKTPWPHVYGVVALAVFSPVLIWNAQHDFVSFRFQGARAGGGGLSLKYVAMTIGGQLGYLTPMIAIPMAWIIGRSIRNLWRDKDAQWRFYLFFGSAPVLVFMFIGLTRKILPHWTLAGFVLLMIPFGRWLGNVWHGTLWKRASVIASGVVIAALLFVLSLHWTNGTLQSAIPAKGDETIATVGWDAVNDYLTKHDLGPEDAFLFTHKWFHGGHVALATQGAYDVMCFNANDGRGFSVWDSALNNVGRDGVVICTSTFEADPRERYGAYFERIEGPEDVEVSRGGIMVKKIRFYICRSLTTRYPTRPQ